MNFSPKSKVREIPDSGGRYAITEDGRVYSYQKCNHAGKWLSVRLGRGGYLHVNIWMGPCHSTSLHRLLAKTFIPNPDNLPQINHKNGNKTDNRLENLEWCTLGDNVRHALATGLVDTRTPAKLAAMRRNGIKARASKLDKFYARGGNPAIEVKAGQVWRDRYKFERYLRILEVIGPKAKVSPCSIDGEPIAAQPTQISVRRFRVFFALVTGAKNA